MNIVLDTNIIVAGLKSRNGASFQVLSAMQNQRFTLILSVPLLFEYEAVLKRGKLAPAIQNNADADLFLDRLAAIGRPVTLYFTWRPVLPDPADDMVLETAISGQAEAIVTFNRKDFKEATRRFDIPIISPATFLQTLKERSS